MSDGSESRGGDRWNWYLPHRAILLLGAVLILIALAGATLGVVNSMQSETLTAKLGDRYLPLLPPVRQMRASANDFQSVAEEAFTSAAPTSTLVPQGESAAAALNKAYLRLEHLLALPGNTDLAPRLAGRWATYVATQGSLGPFLASQLRTPQTAQLAASEKAAEASLDATLATLQGTISDRLDTTANQAQAAANNARVDLLWSIAIGLTIAISVTLLLTRHAVRVERKQAEREAVQFDLTQRIAFEASLQSALEMSKAEATVFDLVAEALDQAAPAMRSELLLADSSTAHFRQVLVSQADADHAGCGVVSPDDCPAAQRARTMVFPSSTALDACPQSPRPRLLRLVRAHEHQRQLHGGLPRHHGRRLATP